MKVRVQVDGETYEVEIGDLDSRPYPDCCGRHIAGAAFLDR